MGNRESDYARERAAEQRGRCRHCGTSDAECMRIVLASGEACCKVCYLRDTHPEEASGTGDGVRLEWIEAGVAAVTENRHDPMCPVMADEKCVTVGGTSTHHDRGAAGDCRCGVKCQCDLIRAVHDNLRGKVQRLPSAAFALTDNDPSPLVWKTDVLDLFDPTTH